MPDRTYDIAIVGSGPAAFSASIYASRYKLSNIVFGKVLGGTISEAHKVCNYPGIDEISGYDLGMKFFEQAKRLGGEHLAESVIEVKKEEDLFRITTDTSKEFVAKSVILATGSNRNRLNLPDENRFLGKGLSYCATCDGMFFKDKVVGVVGGSSAAVMSAVMLADIAKKVYIIYRGTELRGEPMWVDQAMERENIKIIYTTLVLGLEGKQVLERVKLSKVYNGSQYLSLDGLFVEIGSTPNLDLANQLGIELADEGYIKVASNQSTSLEGVWAAGDGTDGSNKFRQVITAASEGSIAANSIFKYLRKSN